MQHSESMTALIGALVKFQRVVKNPKMDEEVTYSGRKFKYASLTSVVDTVRQPLTENDLCFTQALEHYDTGVIALTTVLMHGSGEWISSTVPIQAEKGSQAFGAALTYMKRYSLCAILGVSAEEDTDGPQTANKGQGAAPAPRPTQTPTPAAPAPDKPSSDPSAYEVIEEAIEAHENYLIARGTKEEDILAVRKKLGGFAALHKMTEKGKQTYYDHLVAAVKKAK